MSKTVKIGNLGVGGKNPIRIKGMLKTSNDDLKNLIKEARLLEKEGAEAIRIAIREKKDAGLAKLLRKHISVPLVADIHFQYRLALSAIEQGFEAIRLNPLNIYNKDQVREVAKQAKQAKISIRVGVNSGGFKKKFSSASRLACQMVEACGNYIKVLEREKFFDLMVSLKGSCVASTVIANTMFAKKYNYPLHLGVTSTGSFLEGTIKSSLGIGNLLYQGIGDVIRVSLTAPSFWEIRVAKHILAGLEKRRFGPQVISCPTCSRCEVDLATIADKFKKKLEENNFDKNLNIAIMGCVVNGPGEAYQADIGVAFGKKKAVIFKKDKVLKRSSEKRIIKDLIGEVSKIWT